MKTLLLVLLLCAQIASGQAVTGKVDLSNYYTKRQVDSLLKVKPGEPVVTLPDCDRGPTIEGISKITNTELTLLFDAEGVPKINYEIVNIAGEPLYKDSLVNLSTNTVPVRYKPLPDGSYYLRIEGRSCKSKEVSQRKFTVKSEGPVLPPPIGLDNCKRGPKPERVTNVTTTTALVSWDGDGVYGWDYSIYQGTDRKYFGSAKPTSNQTPITYPGLTPGEYVLSVTGNTCKSDVFSIPFTVPDPNVGGGTSPPPAQGKSKVLGAYTERKAGRNFSFNKTPVLSLKFNEDGTLSDNTEGLNTSGKIHKLDGKNVFYAIGYAVDETITGDYRGFQNVYLPDGIYTIRQFVVDASKIPDIDAFRKGFDGWAKDGNPGVNQNSGQVSEIFISIFSDQKQGNGNVPDWLRVSRALNAPYVLPAMDWSKYNRTFSTGYINKGDSQATYQRVGMQPYIELSNPASQPDTWHTIKSGHHGYQPDDLLSGLGRHFAERMGPSARSVVTGELEENSQGTDPDFYGRGQLVYKAAMDLYKERGLATNPLYTGLFGDYGGDDYHGFFNKNLLFYGRPDFEKSLTTSLHKGYGALNAWEFGFKPNDHEYYTRDHIGVRNLNHKEYFWNRIYYIPYELLYINEKTKLGTKTWQGVDRERKVSVFTTDKIESFVMNNQGGKINIEQARTGEIIPFEGGEILTRQNLQPPVPWDEMYTTGLWSMILTGGIQIWDAPGSTFGQDPNKLHWWSDQFVGWRRSGERDFQPYQSSKNGSPESSGDGLIHSLYSSPIDAAAAGAQVAYAIQGRIEKLSFASYRSSLGEFTANPGEAGYTLNGFGPVNYKLFTYRDAMDQKKGIPLFGEGLEGAVIIYYNGYISPRDYEDNVTVIHAGREYNLGRVYGRQTIIKKL